MSLFSQARAGLAQGLAKAKLAEFLKPYGVSVSEISFESGGRFSVVLDGVLPDDEEEVGLSGRIAFEGDRAVLTYLGPDRRWESLTRAISKHLINKPLPLSPDQVDQLRKLWP
jgi:hypothetical protein